MAESKECTHNCSTCGEDCSSRMPEEFALNEQSSVKHVIGIVSGKGGVGKSIVTSMLSVLFRRRDYGVGILDADITGPSIPRSFGVHDRILTSGDLLLPAETKTGIRLMSLNLMLEDETIPVVWRGPVIAGAVKQFWTDVIWEDVDYMFVDMPPGTGDVPLTVFQSLPLDGIIVVTTPQELVSMIVEKAVKMAGLLNVPVLGLIENMAYVKCPDCGKEINVFGESHAEELAGKLGVDLLARIPFDTRLAPLCDKGIIELMENDYLDAAADAIEKKTASK